MIGHQLCRLMPYLEPSDVTVDYAIYVIPNDRIVTARERRGQERVVEQVEFHSDERAIIVMLDDLDNPLYENDDLVFTVYEKSQMIG